MMDINKSISVTGSSIVNDGNKDILAAYMNANIGNDGSINITKSITDKNIFNIYENQILEDFDKFEKYVYNFAKKEGTTN